MEQVIVSKIMLNFTIVVVVVCVWGGGLTCPLTPEVMHAIHISAGDV